MLLIYAVFICSGSYASGVEGCGTAWSITFVPATRSSQTARNKLVLAWLENPRV
jgi:hypothetical protein